MGRRLFSALSGSGFAYLEGHGLDSEEVEGIFKAARGFFQLPQVKQKQ